MGKGNSRPVLDCSKDKGRTKQSHKDECDIHKILRQYARTGLLVHVAKRPPQFMDVTEVPDYRTALDAVKETEALFMALPSGTRKRFENDPAKFLDWCVDPANEDEMRELGLLPAKAAVGEAPLEAKPEGAGQEAEGLAAEDGPVDGA